MQTPMLSSGEAAGLDQEADRPQCDLSIIIVSYNTEVLLSDCLRSLTKAGRMEGAESAEAEEDRNGNKLKPSAQVIVVDNASTDSSPGMVAEDYPWAELITNRQNKGFAKANNQGLRRARGRYVLLLNPDTVVYEKTLEVMVRYMDKYPRVAASTCRVVLPDGQIDPPSHRGFPTPWRAFCHFTGLGKLFPRTMLFNGYHLGFKDLEKIHEIDSPMGAFYLARGSCIEEVGLLDEDFYWYGEDLDWSYRFKKAGYKVTYVPHVKVLHYHGAASGMKRSSRHVTKATLATRRMAARESVRAMRLFYRKHLEEEHPNWLSRLIYAVMDLMQRVRLARVR